MPNKTIDKNTPFQIIEPLFLKFLTVEVAQRKALRAGPLAKALKTQKFDREQGTG
jgi:hypothetical protein